MINSINTVENCGPCFPQLPRELGLKILSYLSKIDFFVAMRVCKTWWEAAQTPLFWEKEIRILRLESDENPVSAASAKIKQLLHTVMRTDHFLSMEVKTKKAFQQMLKSLNCQYLDKEIADAGKQFLMVELTRINKIKIALHQKLRLGLRASLDLHWLGLRSMEQTEKYVLCIHAWYDGQIAWQHLALILAMEGQPDRALEIINTHVPVDKKDESLAALAFHYMPKGLLEEALNVLSEFTDKRVPFTHFSECCETFLRTIREKGDDILFNQMLARINTMIKPLS